MESESQPSSALPRRGPGESRLFRPGVTPAPWRATVRGWKVRAQPQLWSGQHLR